MADYRLDCCGGFPSHRDNCTAESDYQQRRLAEAATKEHLDALYARYGELIALATRSTTDHNKNLYGCRADGVLEAIHIVEGKPSDGDQ